MKKADIKVGRWYVMRPPRVHRDRVLDGEKGWMVKVLGIGAYTYTRGECDRKEIKPTDQHSHVQLHVKGQRSQQWSDTIVEFEEIIDFRDLLLTKKDWEAKRDALAAERARVQAALDAHNAEIKAAKKLIIKDDFQVSVRMYGSDAGKATISMSSDTFKKFLSAQGRRRLDRVVKLVGTPRDEVTC